MPVCGPRKPAPVSPGQRAPPPAKRARPQYAQAEPMMSRCPAWSGRRRAPRGHDRDYRQSAPYPCAGRRGCPTAILCGQPGGTGTGLSSGLNLRPAAREDPGRQPPTRRLQPVPDTREGIQVPTGASAGPADAQPAANRHRRAVARAAGLRCRRRRRPASSTPVTYYASDYLAAGQLAKPADCLV